MTKRWEKVAVLAILSMGSVMLHTGCELDIAMIEIKPTSVTLEAGTTRQFTAVGFDRTGKMLRQADFSWEVISTDTTSTVGSISDDGLFTAKAKGICEVVAYYGNTELSASATVTVTQTLDSIELDPSSVTVYQDKSQEFTVTYKDLYNIGIEAEHVDSPSWSLSNSDLGTVGQDGLFVADNKGGIDGKVTVTSGTISGFASITVKQVLAAIAVAAGNYGIGQAIYTSAGVQLDLYCYGYDLRGYSMDVSPVWEVSPSGLAGITPDTSNPSKATFKAGPGTGSGSITATDLKYTSQGATGAEVTATIQVKIGIAP